MGLVRVPEQPGVIALGEGGHPPVAVVGLELVLELAAHPVGFVQEQRHVRIVPGQVLDRSATCRA